MEIQISLAESSMFPGFRFSPTDEELISFYLKNKMDGYHATVKIIPEVDICKFEPWDLPEKSVIKSDSEWFFFSPRGKKYPNGSQSKRATASGYWKATGKERNVKSGSNVIGTKRTLVFHMGRAPKGERTEWIMHEYCVHGQDFLVVCRLRKNHEFHSNDTPNQNPLNQMNVPIVENNNSAVSQAGNDQMGFYGEDKLAGGCSKNFSSSHDSYSLEQIDSTLDSAKKTADEFSPGCSGCAKEEEDDGHVFADIMDDNIININFLGSSHLGFNRCETGRSVTHSLQATVLRRQALHSTQNRTHGSRVLEMRNDREEESAVVVEGKVVPPSIKQEPSCMRSAFSVTSLGCSLMHWVPVISLALFLALLGGPVIRPSYASLE